MEKLVLCGRGSCSQALYEKLRENPDLLNGQPTATNFKTSKDGTVVDELYSIKTASQALTGEEMLKNQIYANQLAIEGVLQQLTISDSLYQLPNADINLLNLQRTALKEQLNILFSQKESLLQLAESDRLTLTDSLLNQNNLIMAANELQVANEKITNDLYFSTYARGNYDLNNSQVALLQSIANQCPIVGGRGVYAARSLYEAIEPTVYDDEAICMTIGISEKTTTQSTEISNNFTIVPNPANNTVNFDYSDFEDRPTTIRIYNAMGQVVKEIAINTNTSVTTADISLLLSGVYWCQLMRQDHNIATQKLVIIK